MLRLVFFGLGNLLRLPFLPLWWLLRLVARPRGRWIKLGLRPRIVEFARPLSFLMRFLPGADRALPTSLHRLREFAQRVTEDPRVEGVVWVIPRLESGWSRARSLREVITSLRSAGKKVVAFLPNGGGNIELYVALAADRILMGPQASLMPIGLSVETRYLRHLLDRIGVEVEAFRRGEYKTAAEAATAEEMSEAQREQLTALLMTFDAELRTALAARVGETAAKEFLDRGMQRANQVVNAGVAEKVCYEDALPLEVEPSAPKPVKLISAGHYLAFHQRRFFRRVLPRSYVAVVSIRGVIGEPTSGPRPGVLESTLTALRVARSDPRALGVVLYVNTPGGSVLASDILYHEVQRLREKKPVVVYFGDIAASGGYYIASASDCIIAQPTAITGSIGVISAKIVLKQLFATLGIRTETVKLSSRADLFSLTRELAPEDRELFERDVEGFYQAFLEIVARGRGKSTEEIDRVARGRVWSGADALEVGLIDRLGGFDEALREVRSRTGLSAAAQARLEPRLIHAKLRELPPPEPEKVAQRVPELASLLMLARSQEHAFYLMPYTLRIH